MLSDTCAVMYTGMKVSNSTFTSLVQRYSHKDGKMYFDDYIHCIARLRTMFGQFPQMLLCVHSRSYVWKGQKCRCCREFCECRNFGHDILWGLYCCAASWMTWLFTGSLDHTWCCSVTSIVVLRLSLYPTTENFQHLHCSWYNRLVPSPIWTEQKRTA